MVEIFSGQPQFFDSSAYKEALDTCAVAAEGFIGIDSANLLASTMQANASLFRLSLDTPRFQETLDLAGKLCKVKRNAANMDFVDAVPDFAETVLQDLDTHIQNQPDTYLLPAYKLAKEFTNSSNSSIKQIATTIYVENLDRLLEAEALTNDEVSGVLRYIIETADPEQITILAREAVSSDSALLRRFPRAIDSVLNLSILGPSRDRSLRMEAILEELVGGDVSEIFNAWDDAGRRNSENFATVCQLEKKRRGITRFLIDEYGIMNFARYPVDLLVDQYDTHGESDSLNGIIITARHDHNEAMFGAQREISSLYRQAKSLDCRLKVFEVETAYDIKVAAKSSSLNHGQGSFMLVISHGHNHSMQLGPDPIDHTMASFDLDSEFGEIRDALVPAANIGLISCSVGAKDGFAQTMSTVVQDIDIHSADFDAHLKAGGIQLERVNEELVVRVVFEGYQTNFPTIMDQISGMTDEYDLRTLRTNVVKPHVVATRVYRNGKLIGDYTK